MRRFGVPADLLGTLLWLVDNDTSGFVTGTVIPVDGGFMAYSGYSARAAFGRYCFRK